MSSTDDVHWITSVLPVISSPTSGPSSPSPSASSLDMLHTYTQPQTRPRSLSRSSSRSSFGSFYSFGHASPTLPSRPRSPPRGSSLTPDRTRVPGPTRSSSSLRTALHAATTRTRPAATRSTPALRALMAPVTSSTESLPPPTASSKLTYTHARRISLTVNPGRNLSALDSEDQATSGPTVSAFADGLASGRVPNPTQAYQVARSPSPVQNEDARSSALGSVHVIGMTRFSSGTGAGASGSSSPGSTGIGGLPYSRSTSFHATASPPPSSPRDSAQGSRYADASGNTPDSPFRRDVKTGGVISPEGTPRRSQALSHKDSFGGTGLGLGMGVPGHAVGQHPSGSSPARTHAQQDSLHLAQSGSTGSGLASAAIGNVRADLSALENSALDDADESEELDTSMRGAQTSEADPDNSFVSASVLGPAEGPSDGAATSGERERASFMPGAFVVEAAHARDDQGRSAGSQAFTPSAGASSAALPVPPDAAGPSSGLRASDTSLASASKSISASAFNTPSSSVTSIAAPTTTTPRERLGHAPSAASRGQREMRGSDRVRERTISTGGSSRATLATGNCSKLASGAVAGSIAHSRPNTACSGATVKAGNTSTSPSGGGDSSTNAAAGPSSEANAATPTPTPTAGPSTSSSSRVRNSARTTPQLPSAPNLSPAPPPAMYWSRAPVHGSVPRRAFRAHTANLADEVLWLFGGCDSKGCFRDLYCFDTETMCWSKPKVSGDLPPPRRAHSATMVDKRLFVFAGGDGPNYYNDLYIFDTIALRWTKPEVYGTPPSPRRAHTSNVYDGHLIIFGGGNGVGALNDVYNLDISDLSRLEWRKVECKGKKPIGRGYHSANLVDGKLIVIGGSDGHMSFNDIHILKLDTKVWYQVKTDEIHNRLGHTATQVGSYLFVVGGHDSHNYTPEILTLNLVNLQWETRRVCGRKPPGRGYHQAWLQDSRLFVHGGFDGKEIYDDLYFVDLAACAYLPQITSFTVELDDE